MEILKALYRDVRILILDEPTAVLTPFEIQALFSTLKNLVAQGLSVIFISHKLKEAIEISTRVVILRKERIVGERATNESRLFTHKVQDMMQKGLLRSSPGGADDVSPRLDRSGMGREPAAAAEPATRGAVARPADDPHTFGNPFDWAKSVYANAVDLPRLYDSCTYRLDVEQDASRNCRARGRREPGGRGGAFLTMSAFDSFFFEMINGRSWVCIALVVFGSWKSCKALLGAVPFAACGAY